MSSNIKVSLAADKLEVKAGEAVETSIVIKNQSSVVDQFFIKIEGIDPLWWSLSTSSVSLFPGDQDEVKLTIRAPRESVAKAGSYTFQVKAVSQANTQDFTIAEAYLVIQGFASWEMYMSPTKIKGRSGIYHIKLSNHGNSDITLNLGASDPEESLVYEFDKSSVSIPAGSTAQVSLNVKPLKGRPEKTYDFQVEVKPDKARVSSREIQRADGQLEYKKKRFPWWIIGLIIGLLVVAAAAFFLMQLFNEPGPVQKISVDITSPAEGDKWAMASTQEIRWTTNYTASSTVKLEYSLDDGKAYIIITDSAPNSGAYNWKLPDKVSDQCMVRITVLDSRGDFVVKDVSGTFSIFAVLKVTPLDNIRIIK